MNRTRLFPERHRLVVMASVCALMPLTQPVFAAQEQGIQIRTVIWGFDGKVAPNHFNPLSVLIDNPGNEAWSGRVRLRHLSGPGQYVGAPLVEEVFIAPFARRWVQFYPFIGPEPGTWRLQWQGGSEEMPQIRTGRGAVVMLDAPGSYETGGRGVKHFPDDAFPATVAGTSGLRSVIIDHLPRWEQPRRQAFIDWIQLGGFVHVLQDDDAEPPQFTNELAILNTPFEVQRLGRGAVFRHSRRRGGLDATFVKEIRALEDRQEAAGFVETEEIPDLRTHDAYRTGYSPLDYGAWDSAGAFQAQLKEMTRPDHNWPLIYLLSLLYIALIFPGCYLVGRRRGHYLITYGAILGSAAVFSFAFLLVGRRGYGEETVVNAVAIATPIEGDSYDVTQWSDVFVTRGDTYDITHKGAGTLYATAQNVEAVRGAIDNGLEGRFMVDIPPFSSRPFVHRTRLKLPPLEVSVVKFTGTEQLGELELKVGPEFPENPTRVLAMYRDQVYTLRYDSGRGVLRKGQAQGSASSFINVERLSGWNMGINFMYSESDISPETRYDNLLDPLLAHHLGILEKSDLSRIVVPQDRVRLLVYAEMGPEFELSTEELRKHVGRVLYSIDVFRTDTP